MNHLATPSRSSWLSLVAETAGVAGTAIARVELGSRGVFGPTRAVIQLLDDRGHVVGATYWYGEGSDLAEGATVDIGYDYFASGELRIVAWVDTQLEVVAARAAVPPAHAVSRAYDPSVAIKLMLVRPAPSPGPARSRIQAADGFVTEAA